MNWVYDSYEWTAALKGGKEWHGVMLGTSTRSDLVRKILRLVYCVQEFWKKCSTICKGKIQNW